MIRRDGLLAPTGWFIAQHSIREPFETPRDWDYFREERYGDSALSFFRHVKQD